VVFSFLYRYNGLQYHIEKVLMKQILRLIFLTVISVLTVFLTASCSQNNISILPAVTDTSANTPVYSYEIVDTYPHDPEAFTQGLMIYDGELYEGTGLWGSSTVRKVDLETGEVLRIQTIPDNYFGEGITIFNDKLYQLTYRAKTGFIYDMDSFQQTGDFSYPTEGWGITHNGEYLIMSDGTAVLHFLDPDSLNEVSRINVYDENGPVNRLNELEFIQGFIYANVWQTDRIAIIDSDTGKLAGWIDLTGILGAEYRGQQVDVLNGIAFDTNNNSLFVTGKWWPVLFEITISSPE